MRMKNKMKWGKITVFHIFLGPIFLYFCTQNAAQYNCTMHSHSAHSYYEHTIAYSYRCVFTVGKQASQRSQIVWCVWFIRRHLLWCMQYACTRAFVCVRHMTGECAEKIYFVIPFINLCLRSSVAATATRNKINDTERAASARRSQHFFFGQTSEWKMRNASTYLVVRLFVLHSRYTFAFDAYNDNVESKTNDTYAVCLCTMCGA